MEACSIYTDAKPEIQSIPSSFQCPSPPPFHAGLIAGGTWQAKLETGDASVFPWGPTKPPKANNVSWGRFLRTYVRLSVAVDDLQLRSEVDMAGILLGMDP